jgi:hypothetical protein
MIKGYTALRNGSAVMSGTLNEVVEFIRLQESAMNRATEHSPWTIGMVQGN